MLLNLNPVMSIIANVPAAISSTVRGTLLTRCLQLPSNVYLVIHRSWRAAQSVASPTTLPRVLKSSGTCHTFSLRRACAEVMAFLS